MTLRRCRLALLSFVVAACGASTSPRWQQGGAPTPLDSAYWSRKDSIIELRPTGEIIEQDTVLFRVDRAGRVSDAEGKPVAVLQSDGWLVAEDETIVGWIGPGTSFRADRQTPLVHVYASGDAVVADGEGAWLPAGRWDYCDGAMLRTCTLVAHMVAARDRARARTGSGSGSGSSAAGVIQLLELLKLVR